MRKLLVTTLMIVAFMPYVYSQKCPKDSLLYDLKELSGTFYGFNALNANSAHPNPNPDDTIMFKYNPVTKTATAYEDGKIVFTIKNEKWGPDADTDPDNWDVSLSKDGGQFDVCIDSAPLILKKLGEKSFLLYCTDKAKTESEYLNQK
jgi:hypothetical protein